MKDDRWIRSNCVDRWKSTWDEFGGCSLFYDDLSQSRHDADDLLRAVVVFLHATLEDSLRDFARERLPLASREAFERLIKVKRSKIGAEFSLADLTLHRGRTVDELLKERVGEYLDRESFNQIEDILSLLLWLEIDPAILSPDHRSHLQALMSRRHRIAHRFDKKDNAMKAGDEASRRDSRHSVDIDRDVVAFWIETVDAFLRGLVEIDFRSDGEF